MCNGFTSEEFQDGDLLAHGVTQDSDKRLILDKPLIAAQNNVHLCDRIYRSHGCETELTETYFRCIGSPPRFYPNVVILTPSALQQLTGQFHGGFKDGTGKAEPDPTKFHRLVAAQWIWMDSSLDRNTSLAWSKVTTDERLMEWEVGWSHCDDVAGQHPRQFPASLLEDPALSFLAGHQDEKVVAGGIFNDSGPVIGISNTFGIGLDPTMLWEEIVALCHSEFPNRSLTGYEREESLLAALNAGFQSVGELSVWLPIL